MGGRGQRAGVAAVSEALRERGRAEGVIHVQAWLVFNFAKAIREEILVCPFCI